MRGWRAFVVFVPIYAFCSAASAQVGKTTTGAVAGRNKVVKEAGVRLLAKVAPEAGFVDDAFAFDGAGGRLAIVVTDAAQQAEVRVLDLAQGAKVLSARPLPAEILPTKLAFVGDKDEILVVGEDQRVDARPTIAVLLDATGKATRRWGPATDIATTKVNGVDVVTAWTRKSGVAYDVAATTLAGKSYAKRTLKLGKGGLDVELLGWRDAYLSAVVLQKGAFIKKLDQRGPSHEARWDAKTGKIGGAKELADPLEHKRVSEIRASWPNRDTFVRVTEDLRGIELVDADDKRTPIELPVELTMYDPKSFTARPQPGGGWVISLTVDPVNPAALAKKIADPEAIDLFRLDAGATKLQKVARLAKGERGFVWQATAGRWAVLRKHKGFSRGGPTLEIYDLILLEKSGG